MLAVSAFLAACSSLPTEVERPTSYVITDVSDTRVARAVDPMIEANPGLSGFDIVQDGADAFATRIRLIQSADKAIDIQYYIWHVDLTGKGMYANLLQAADRGVRVRLLLDDLDTAGKDAFLQKIDAHPEIEVRVYNPFANRDIRGLDFITDTDRIDHRMHTKTLTVDNRITVFGGRNIGDEYFAAGKEVNFNDIDAMAFGPVVQEVSDQFDLFWNSEWVYPVSAFESDQLILATDMQAMRDQLDQHMALARESEYAVVLEQLQAEQRLSFDSLELSWSKWFLAFDYPDKVVREELNPETNLAPYLKKTVDLAANELLIVSPYFVPGEEFTRYLTKRASEGLTIKILTNSLQSNDVGLVHAGYMRYREDLIKGGVELYEYKATGNREVEKRLGRNKLEARKRSLHAKFFGFDKQYLFIGSFNVDARSTYLNTEMGAYFSMPTAATRLSKVFDSEIMSIAYRVKLDEDGELSWHTVDEQGQEIQVDHEPDTSFWQRFNTRILSPIVPESEL